MILSNEMLYALINGCYTGLYIVLVQLIALFARRIVNYRTKLTRPFAVVYGVGMGLIAASLALITIQYPSPYNYIYTVFACCLTISIFTDAYALLIYKHSSSIMVSGKLVELMVCCCSAL